MGIRKEDEKASTQKQDEEDDKGKGKPVGYLDFSVFIYTSFLQVRDSPHSETNFSVFCMQLLLKRNRSSLVCL